MQLQEILPAEIIRINEPMSKHTSFRIGGPADILVMPRTVEDVMTAMKWAVDNNVKYLLVGAGSNMLVRDGGFRGMIIKLGSNFKGIEVAGLTVKAKAGTKLAELARKAAENGLSGLEFAEGIPGTVGGAVYMNAGAYDGQMSNVVKMVTVLSNGELQDIKASDLGFGYRKSVFQAKHDLILEVEMMLSPGDPERIREKMKGFAHSRKEKQPLEFPSAGSVFKRPEGKYVGPMIEELGLKGYRIGDAEISTKHAGFIVNKGEAKAAEVLELISYIQSRVREKFSVELETEVLIIGED
ncbi:MAG: UDP-N-acetylmuramate dehydrogenase [Candidatus Saccharibacteria bacterium]